jgi:DNA polymerase elongation subunit (family B)
MAGRTILEFYPFDIDSITTKEGRTLIRLFGVTKDNKKVIVLDPSLNPYFYVLINPEKSEKAINAATKMEVTAEERRIQPQKVEVVKRNFVGKPQTALKISVQQTGDIAALKEEAKKIPGYLDRVEVDISFTKRYLIDRKMSMLTLWRVTGEEAELKRHNADFFIKAEELVEVSDEVIAEPKIIAFDIETYNPAGVPRQETDPIIMVSFLGKHGPKKVVTWKKFNDAPDYVDFVDSERELLQYFFNFLKKHKPDIIVGYNSDNFDLPYILSRAKKYNLNADVGIDGSELAIGRKAGNDVARIAGIVHIDLFVFIKNMLAPTMKTETFSLSAVAEELIGEKKLAGVSSENMFVMWDAGGNDLRTFAEYNLHDSQLTLNLMEKLKYSIFEVAKLVGQPLFDVSRMTYGQCVEWYLARWAERFNEFIPLRPISKTAWMRTYEGAYVHQPKPGVYNNIAIFDFRSLYPSLIVSHNICPTTISCDCCKKGDLTPEINGKRYSFCKKKKGFIPSVIEDLINRRARIKEILKKVDKKDADYAILSARSYALKTVANAMYGYLGFAKSRWYSLECASSITAWGRQHIKSLIEEAERQGFEVIYGDSLPYNRHIFVKFENGDIRIVKIGELYDRHRYEKHMSTLSFGEDGKTEFKPVKGVIRHEYKGDLLKITTKYGSTIVTPQHSVYCFNGELHLTDAKTLKKGDKMISLTNPKIEINYREGHTFDMADMDFGEYSKELLLYSDNLMFKNEDGVCPYCKKNVNLSTHVHAKHRDRRETIKKESKFSWVGGLNGKVRKIPRYWILDKEVAWLLGFYCAEGSVSDVKTKSGRKCLLSFGGHDLELIKKVKQILDVKTGVPTKIIENYDKRINKKMFYYRVQCMPIVTLFQNGFCCGKGSEFKKVPWFIFTADEQLRRAFVKGYLDGDGNSRKEKGYKTHFVKFSTKSIELAEGLCFLLKTLNHGLNAWKNPINHVYWLHRQDKPKIVSLRLQSAKRAYENFCLSEVKSIEKIPGEKYVYDIEVEGVHNFVDAEGMILVHNTDSLMVHLKDKKIGEANEFLKKVNEGLPDVMELELQGIYPKGLFVSKKGGEGAKKRYVLLDEGGHLILKGFQSVRRDWSKISKDVQVRVLHAILIDNSIDKAVSIIKETINRLKEGDVRIDEIVIHTQLTRRVENYDSIGPHVAAVIKAQKGGFSFEPGQIIKFIVTKGEGSISDRSYILKEYLDKELEYDADYYIDNQVLPAVEKIFEVLGYSKDELKGKVQTTLSGFFK